MKLPIGEIGTPGGTARLIGPALKPCPHAADPPNPWNPMSFTHVSRRIARPQAAPPRPFALPSIPRERRPVLHLKPAPAKT
jgi:hypothetical protein